MIFLCQAGFCSRVGVAAQLRRRAVHIAQAWCWNGFVDLTTVQPGVSKNSMIELASLELGHWQSQGYLACAGVGIFHFQGPVVERAALLGTSEGGGSTSSTRAAEVAGQGLVWLVCWGHWEVVG